MASTPPQNKRARLVANDDGILQLLPAELLSEILLRLPAKSLCRLRLVCRTWLALTHDPGFANAHSSRHPLVARLAHSKSGQTCAVEFTDLSGRVVRPKRARHVEFGRSPYKRPADLVCLSQRSHEACLLNTDTGGVTVLHTRVRDDFVYVVARVPSTGECKLLRYHALLCAVATLGGGNKIRWRKRAEPPGGVSPLFSHRAVVGGVVCFLRRGWGDVALFDLATEEWGPVTLQAPPPLNERGREKKLIARDYWEEDLLQVTEMDGCLVMAHGDFQARSMDLWFLVDMENGVWTKRHSLRCPPVWKREDYQWMHPWAVLGDGTVLVWAELKQVLKAYDPTTNKWTDLTGIESYRNYVGMLKVSLLCWGKSKFHPNVLELSDI